MIKTLIIEDKLYIRKSLIIFIESLNKNLTIIGECESVKGAITVAIACKPDLIFLDINLSDGNAFEFLEKTNQLSYKVIFITAYKQYAIQALKAGAVDYILKPINPKELDAAIDKALDSDNFIKDIKKNQTKKQLNINNERIILSFRDNFQVVLLRELTYCMSNKGYTIFHLINGKSFMTSKPLKEYENLLPKQIFFRTHQSYFVNVNYIDTYQKSGYVTLKNGRKIPVSNRKKEMFLSKFLNQNKS